ncbi:hypothetical protein U1Q18_028587 [Sarracenia purpurea var. burkii]
MISEQSLPNFCKYFDDNPMMTIRVQRQESFQQVLQISASEYMLFHDHFHHRTPEISVRIDRPLHHRETFLHFPLQWR